MISKEYSILFDMPNMATVIVGGEDPVPAAEAGDNTQAVTAQTPAPQSAQGGPKFSFYIAIYALLFGALYFLFIRPNRKKEKNIREMQSALKVGDNIVTSSGLYGVINSVGDDCFIVDFGTNKSIRIPVRKIDVMGVKIPNIQAPKDVNEPVETKGNKKWKGQKDVKEIEGTKGIKEIEGIEGTKEIEEMKEVEEMKKVESVNEKVDS